MPDQKHNSIQRILLVASKLFAQNRYGSVTMRMVAKEADVSLASINYHYNSKQELYVAVARHIFAPIHKSRRLSLNKMGEAPEFDVVARAYIESIAKVFLHPKGKLTAAFLWRFIYEDKELVTLVLQELINEESLALKSLLKKSCPDRKSVG